MCSTLSLVEEQSLCLYLSARCRRFVAGNLLGVSCRATGVWRRRQRPCTYRLYWVWFFGGVVEAHLAASQVIAQAGSIYNIHCTGSSGRDGKVRQARASLQLGGSTSPGHTQPPSMMRLVVFRQPQPVAPRGSCLRTKILLLARTHVSMVWQQRGSNSSCFLGINFRQSISWSCLCY